MADTARKRTLEMMASDREVAVEMYLRGSTHQEIADYVNSRRDPEQHISRSQVRYDIDAAMKEWHEANVEKTGVHIATELARLRILETEAWKQFRVVSELGEEEIQTIEQLVTPSSEDSVAAELAVTKRITTARSSRELALQWFKQLCSIAEQRQRVLGISKLSVEVNKTTRTIVKAYVGIDPGELWGAKPALTHASVIEGEVEDG